jgi:large subunit ribosomal protein L35Ae
MEAVILNFRRGRRTQSSNQMILRIEDVDNKEKAKTFLGKKVSWICPGKNKKEIKGLVKMLHGNSGLVRVHFERGMPGQCLGKKVQVK